MIAIEKLIETLRNDTDGKNAVVKHAIINYGTEYVQGKGNEVAGTSIEVNVRVFVPVETSK